jgi:hypothetical protein
VDRVVEVAVLEHADQRHDVVGALRLEFGEVAGIDLDVVEIGAALPRDACAGQVPLDRVDGAAVLAEPTRDGPAAGSELEDPGRGRVEGERVEEGGAQRRQVILGRPVTDERLELRTAGPPVADLR